MRNMASTIAMDLECDYLLFLDDDVLVPIDSLQKLLDTDADIAAGHVIIRGYPFDNMFFKYTDSSKKELLSVKDKDLPEVPGVIDVDAVGFSLCLIKTELLRKVPAPHFITGVSNTEDIYFCLKSKEIKSNLSMVVDTSIRCGHILWSEVVSPDNKEDYSKYYLTQNTDAAKPKEKQDRSSGYNGIIHQLFGLFKCD